MQSEGDFEIHDPAESSESQFVNFYELMQISPNAEAETIERVYRMLAARYHPDNPETGDDEIFLLLKRAKEILSDPKSRADYDTLLEAQSQRPMSVFSLKEFTKGIDGEGNRRMGVLCLLYNRLRVNLEEPGLSVLDLESVMSCPREHLMFALWYLREMNLARQDEHSSFVITGQGVDYVEEHLPKNKMLYKLLKAAEVGSTRKASENEWDPAQDSAAEANESG